MKTIRHNTFETNSSSTHSFTIVNKSELKSPIHAPIVVGDVLLPKDLRLSKAYVDISTHESGYILTATTKHEKAALFLHHLQYFLDNWKWDNEKLRESVNEPTLKSYTYNLIKDKCGYRDISVLETYDFMYYSEYGENKAILDLFESEDFETFKNKLENYVETVILNKDIIVIEKDEPY